MGVRVGPGRSEARWRLRSQEDVDEVLERLRELRPLKRALGRREAASSSVTARPATGWPGARPGRRTSCGRSPRTAGPAPGPPRRGSAASSIPPAAIATSPLARATQTADVLARAFGAEAPEELRALVPDAEPAEVLPWLVRPGQPRPRRAGRPRAPPRQARGLAARPVGGLVPGAQEGGRLPARPGGPAPARGRPAPLDARPRPASPSGAVTPAPPRGKRHPWPDPYRRPSPDSSTGRPRRRRGGSRACSRSPS